MPIRAVKATSEGIRVLEQYNGETEEVSFLGAIILTRCQETTAAREIFSFLRNEYPLTLADGAISGTIAKLEKLGYAKVYHEITLDNSVVIEVAGVRILTKLGDFISRNVKDYPMPVTKICDELSWYGEINLTTLEQPIKIRLA